MTGIRSSTSRVFLSFESLTTFSSGCADARRDVALVAVVLDDLLRVLVELGFLIGAAAGEHPRPRIDALLVLLHLLAQLAVADRLVADELDRVGS